MRMGVDLLAPVTEAIVEVKPELAGRTIGMDTCLYAPEEPSSVAVDNLGFDSLDALDLVTLLEEKLDTRLTGDVNLTSVKTVRDVIDAILVCAAHSEGKHA